MGRPNIFPVDTCLYHPTEGARIFPRGEQDPGALWSESPAGNPLGGKTTDAAVKELVEANDRIEALGQQLASKDHDLAVLAGERDAANAKVITMTAELEDLKTRLANGTPLPAPAPAPMPEMPEVHDKRTVETVAERAAVEVPDDWSTRPFFAQKAIAAKLTDQPVKTAADVRKAIEAHLAKAA